MVGAGKIASSVSCLWVPPPALSSGELAEQRGISPTVEKQEKQACLEKTNGRRPGPPAPTYCSARLVPSHKDAVRYWLLHRALGPSSHTDDSSCTVWSAGLR